MERIKAHLAEVSLVTFGAYGELASITGMRDGQPQMTPRLDEARKIWKVLFGMLTLKNGKRLIV